LEIYILVEMNNGHCLKFDEENNLKLQIFGFRCSRKHLNTHIYIEENKEHKREKNIQGLAKEITCYISEGIRN